MDRKKFPGSKEYWQARILEVEELCTKNAAKANNELQNHYAAYYRKYTEEYYKIIKPYIIEGKNEIDTDRFFKDLKNDIKLQKKVENLGNSIRKFREFMDEETYKKMTEAMSKIYEEAFIILTTNVEVATGAIKLPNKKKIEQVINTKFFGENYSDRIWRNNAKFEAGLTNTLREGITEGWGYKKAAKFFKESEGFEEFSRIKNPAEYKRAVRKEIKKASYNTYRLVFTEMRWISSMAKKDAWKDMGFKEVEIIHENPKCKLCQNMVGKVFTLSKAKIGTDLPPYHPNCCATYAPAVSDWLITPEGSLAEAVEKNVTKHNKDYYRAGKKD